MYTTDPNANAPQISTSNPDPDAIRPSGSDEVPSEDIVIDIVKAFKTKTEEPLPGDRIAQSLLQNMGRLSDLVRQGKLTQQQFIRVSSCATFSLSTLL